MKPFSNPCIVAITVALPVRTLVSMMVLKEAQGISDQKLYEDCRFNMLTHSAIGLLNADDMPPTESTYYLFRKRVNEYAQASDENLFDTVFAQITKDQCVDFEVSGKRIRMDSKLLGSNIPWLSRYELVHETLRLFHGQIKDSDKLDKPTADTLNNLLKIDANKVTYTHTAEEVKDRFVALGQCIHALLVLFSSDSSAALQQVFDEQFQVSEHEQVAGRPKEEISAQSIQSPHDTDCHYRNKDGTRVKGYSINVAESCDDQKDVNLIGHVQVSQASTADTDFLQQGISQCEQAFTDKAENVHTDGACHSPDNQQFCKEKGMELHLHAIQGAKGRYRLTVCENGELSVWDTKTGSPVQVTKITGRDKQEKWRIKTNTGYRYFTQQQIDTCLIRNQIEQTPTEILQKRNNVEATIFQVGYHYPNAKGPYRGLIRHQIWANVRCLWVNFARILKYMARLGKNILSIPKNILKKYTDQRFFASELVIMTLMRHPVKNLANMK